VAYLIAAEPVLRDTTGVPTLPPDAAPVVTEAGNGLAVAYVVDKGDRLTYVQGRHLAACAIDRAELHRRALDNLTALARTKLELRPHGNIMAAFAGGHFEASLLLVDGLWDRGLQHLAPNGYIAAAPARDILAFCDAASETGIAELRQLIDRVRNGNHPLTPQLLRRQGARWEPYRGEPHLYL
jgi:uncharacterized protein YtpQ (UPF0354 family)